MELSLLSDPMPSFFRSLLRKLMRDLSLSRTSVRSFQLDEEMSQSLQDLAERQQRPLNQVASDLLSQALHQQQKDSEIQRNWITLSPREQQVVALVCLGYTNRQIAASLSISSETVKTYLDHARLKFGVRSKAELRQVLAAWNFSEWDIPLPR